jgi:hypothetical protein
MFKPLILILIGLLYGGASARQLWEARALDERGKDAIVEPIEKYTQITKSRYNTADQVSYETDVSFRTESGERITVRRTLNVDLINKFATRQPVMIRYLPDNPKVTQLGAEGASGMGEVVIGAIIALIGVFWFRSRINAPFNRD